MCVCVYATVYTYDKYGDQVIRVGILQINFVPLQQPMRRGPYYETLCVLVIQNTYNYDTIRGQSPVCLTD